MPNRIPSLSSDQKRQLVESIFNFANEGLIVSDLRGKILLINPATEKQFGYANDELAGKAIEILIPEQYQSRHKKHREGYQREPVTRKMGVGRDLFGKKKDGTVFPVEISLTPFKSNGETFILAFVIDITVRKQIELDIADKQEALEKATLQLKASNEQLEKKVNDRTQVLREALTALEKSKADLSEALEKEKELNELKSRFLSMASHEFRTPLTAIMSSAGLIGEYQEKEQQPKRIRHVERIKSAVSNLTDILGDFLSLSRIEEGGISVEYSLFSFNELLDEVCNELKPIAKPGQKLDCRLEGGDEIILDRKLLRQVMVNLLSNAIKYSSENQLVSLHAVHSDDMLEVEVRDQGIGISEADQQHLFERFFRGYNATNIQGTGLGLNIVSNYVELLDGVITFESRLNTGSVFRVRFPLKTKTIVHDAHPADRRQQRSKGKHR